MTQKNTAKYKEPTPQVGFGGGHPPLLCRERKYEMLGNVVKFELKKQFRKRLLTLAFMEFMLSAVGLGIYLTYSTPQRTSYEAFSFSIFTILPMALPLFAALSTGITLAEERSLGLLPLFLSRGVSPCKYILGKTIGSMMAQTCLTLGTLGAFLLATHMFFPAGPILTFGATCGQSLALENPLAHCMASILVYVLAALAFNGTALFVSVWVSNIFVVAATPTILYFAAFYISALMNSNLNPYLYLALNQHGPSTFASVAVYWIIAAVFSHGLAVLCFSLKKNWS